MDWKHHRNEFHYDLHSYFTHIDKASEKLTPIEKIMLYRLAELALELGFGNVTIHEQKKVGDYTADFIFEYDQFRLSVNKILFDIECDGHEFHEKTKEQASKDKKRDRFFTTNGYHVLRYTGTDICNNQWQVREDILQILCPERKGKDGS